MWPRRFFKIKIFWAQEVLKIIRNKSYITDIALKFSTMTCVY
jgi:hypothetical protein